MRSSGNSTLDLVSSSMSLSSFVSSNDIAGVEEREEAVVSNAFLANSVLRKLEHCSNSSDRLASR